MSLEASRRGWVDKHTGELLTGAVWVMDVGRSDASDFRDRVDAAVRKLGDDIGVISYDLVRVVGGVPPHHPTQLFIVAYQVEVEQGTPLPGVGYMPTLVDLIADLGLVL